MASSAFSMTEFHAITPEYVAAHWSMLDTRLAATCSAFLCMSTSKWSRTLRWIVVRLLSVASQPFHVLERMKLAMRSMPGCAPSPSTQKSGWYSTPESFMV